MSAVLLYVLLGFWDPASINYLYFLITWSAIMHLHQDMLRTCMRVMTRNWYQTFHGLTQTSSYTCHSDQNFLAMWLSDWIIFNLSPAISLSHSSLPEWETIEYVAELQSNTKFLYLVATMSVNMLKEACFNCVDKKVLGRISKLIVETQRKSQI